MTPMLAQRPRTDRAFERLYCHHVREVYRYALVVLPNPEDAEDVTQTTFLNAYRAFERGQRPQSTRNWLIAIAHKLCQQRVRQQARLHEVGYEEHADEAVPDEETPSADDRLANDARALELKLRDIQVKLSGDPTMARRSEPSGPSMINRLNAITNSLWSNTLDAPTATQRRQYEIVAAEFEMVLAQLKPVIETDLRRVEEAAEAAGAPWTSGRLPVWRP